MHMQCVLPCHHKAGDLCMWAVVGAQFGCAVGQETLLVTVLVVIVVLLLLLLLLFVVFPLLAFPKVFPRVSLELLELPGSGGTRAPGAVRGRQVGAFWGEDLCQWGVCARAPRYRAGSLCEGRRRRLAAAVAAKKARSLLVVGFEA